MPNKLDNIRKLSPDERIRKLRTLIDEETKELKAAKKLITESQQEIKDKIDQTRLEEEHAPNITRVIRRSEEETSSRELEQTVSEEEQRFREANVLERQYLRERTSQELYSIATNLKERVAEKGYLNNQERAELYVIGKEAQYRRASLEDGSYIPTREGISTTLSLVENISKSLYKSTGIGYRRAA